MKKVDGGNGPARGGGKWRAGRREETWSWRERTTNSVNDGVWRRRIEERRPARDPFSGRLAARTDLSVLWCV